ncbi:DUF1150 family protein [Gluconobacter morbifer]|uniref:DUF1150 domain-containing protein n=1 Tax=Gluconobacter morbifer G707 TaxID=1088869 RepID=G6XGD3_9PROT|nr:DUF1150 family protein [Gluconobacter morbifer]EHH69241.1 hypothetical protein GMO_05480 [Gluconobacter morbifer G707]
MNNTFQNGEPAEEVLPADLRQITGQQLRTLGLSQLAYVKSVIHDGELVVAIHAADGTPMAVADDEESALDAILEHEMIPTLLQ